MKTIRNLLRKIEALDPDRICEDAVDNTRWQLLSLNKDQMYAGKTRTGADIGPTYLDDPYFKSRAAAQRYSDWKDYITPPTTGRRKGIPNLFINGFFYGSITVTVANDRIHEQSNWRSTGSKIEQEHPGIYGLGGDYKDRYLEQFLRPEFKKLMEGGTGLKMEFHGLRF